ncbi:Tubulin/FtsZ, GTPase domain-containing protein [Polychytrium aggregatum]|uniref:Tubulin/FtsZ, GTPase domain-containing protein n=1 Tax=Polychytrium aggregatum TaxID=110093 RepID=UPI0022FF255B|nr:Tubulin/FtsZ, GTPase domain-containing protein [Polychytrium aggregatum]KAI9207328.1 Tubulin/FtsZ, GTPase domain-containing protein [Polychytrium aggregatum]
MPTKEIITLQIGHSANFVGTHFWNQQEALFGDDGDQEPELSHDVLFRQGKSSHGDETYTPRLLALDLKGSLGSLKLMNEIYERDTRSDSWANGVDRHESDLHPKNAFLQHLDEAQLPAPEQPPVQSYAKNLDQTVRVWSDFNRMFYHPKSIVQLPQYTHGSEEQPFALFSQGMEVMADADTYDDVIDERLRFFMEECDALQGINVIADVGDGFGGIAASITSTLRDDHQKLAITTFGVDRPLPPSATLKSVWAHNVNSAIALQKLSENSSLFVPLKAATPATLDPLGWSRYQRPNLNLPYHWSAEIAAAIDTITIPYRLKKQSLAMYDSVSVMNARGNLHLAALSMAMPCPMPADDPLATLSRPLKIDERIPWMRDLSTGANFDQCAHETAQVSVLRGSVPGVAKASLVAAFDAFASSFPVPIGASQSFVVDTALRLGETFPQFFSGLGDQGQIQDPSSAEGATEVSQLPVLARLRATPRLRGTVLAKADALRSAKVASMQGGGVGSVGIQFEKGDFGMDREMLQECEEQLREICDAYAELA